MQKNKNELENCYSEFLDFLSAEKNTSKLTNESYINDFKVFMEFLALVDIEPSLSTISTPVVRKYVTYLKTSKGFANNTIRRKIHSLSSFFKYLMELEYIEKNPMLAIHAPQEEKRLPIYIKENEITMLLKAPKKYARFQEHILRDTVMLELLVYTGARRSEILALNFDDCDFGRKTITIMKGKGGKQRTIPMVEPLTTDLWKYLQTRLPIREERAVLISDKGTRMSTSNFQSLFMRYLDKSCLDNKGYSPHKCRHSFASLLCQKGVDLISIKELLGHEDLNSTKIYTHTDVKHLKNAVEKLSFV